MFQWFWDLIDLLASSWKDKEGRCLFLGLDNAGKTTLLGQLSQGTIHQHLPTRTPNVERLNLGSISTLVVDMGGHEDARRLWRDYFTAVDGIVFLVDAAAPHRFAEAKTELDKLLGEEELAHVPFAILSNKIDMPKACGIEAIKQALGVTHHTTGAAKPPAGVRPLEVFPCSVVNKQGYGDGLRWISQFFRDAK